MAPPLAPSSQEPAPTASVLVEVRLPPQVALHRLASPLVGLEHDVVGLVGEPRPAVLDGEPRVGPRARAPSRTLTAVYPRRVRVAAARVEATPSAQVTTIGACRSGASVPIVHSSRLRQSQRVPGTWPRAYASLWSTLRISPVPRSPGATRATRWRAASQPKGTTVGCSLSTAPPAAVHAGRPPASTATSGNPMRRSHEAVITERAKPSQTRTIDAARTATYSSVACTAWPPGAQTAAATWPAAYSSAVRTSRT